MDRSPDLLARRKFRPVKNKLNFSFGALGSNEKGEARTHFLDSVIRELDRARTAVRNTTGAPLRLAPL